MKNIAWMGTYEKILLIILMLNKDMIFNTVSSLTGAMTVDASFENDKDSISEARLGDIMLLELEPTLEVTGSFTATKIIPSFT